MVERNMQDYTIQLCYDGGYVHQEFVISANSDWDALCLSKKEVAWGLGDEVDYVRVLNSDGEVVHRYPTKS